MPAFLISGAFILNSPLGYFLRPPPVSRYGIDFGGFDAFFEALWGGMAIFFGLATLIPGILLVIWPKRHPGLGILLVIFGAIGLTFWFALQYKVVFSPQWIVERFFFPYSPQDAPSWLFVLASLGLL